MRRLDIRWMMFAAVATLTPACTYILGLEGDVDSLSSGTGGTGGAGGTTTTSNGGAGGTGGNGGCGAGQDDCGGGCVDLDTSVNCGVCGRNCDVDACVSGHCEVTQVGSTMAGGATSAVAVDSSGVYWADRGGERVMRADLDGANPMELVTGEAGLEDIEVLPGMLFWTGSGNVGAYNLILSSNVPIAGGESNPFGITVHDTFAYWANFASGAIRRAPTDGGMQPTDWYSNLSSQPSAIVNDGTNLYWTNVVNGGGVLSLPISGGSETQLVTEDAARELAISPQFLYWVRQTEESIVRMLPTTGQMPTMVVSGLGRLQGLAVDGEDVFFTVNEAPTCEVMRTRGDGMGTPLKLADGCTDSPFGLAVDASHVYWSDIDNTVKRVAR